MSSRFTHVAALVATGKIFWSGCTRMDPEPRTGRLLSESDHPVLFDHTLGQELFRRCQGAIAGTIAYQPDPISGSFAFDLNSPYVAGKSKLPEPLDLLLGFLAYPRSNHLNLESAGCLHSGCGGRKFRWLCAPENRRPFGSRFGAIPHGRHIRRGFDLVPISAGCGHRWWCHPKRTLRCFDGGPGDS